MNKKRPFRTVNKLVNENVKLAHFWANRLAFRFGRNEALSLALKGLLYACEHHDDSHGCRLGTFISVCIKNEFRGEFQRQKRKMRGPDAIRIPLDAPVRHESNMTVSEVVADDRARQPDVAMVATDIAEEVAGLLELVDARTRLILEYRYGLNGRLPHTLEDISKKLGVTRERVRQIEAGALRMFWRKKNGYQRKSAATNVAA